MANETASIAVGLQSLHMMSKGKRNAAKGCTGSKSLAPLVSTVSSMRVLKVVSLKARVLSAMMFCFTVASIFEALKSRGWRFR